jgi:hypothetical protein
MGVPSYTTSIRDLTRTGNALRTTGISKLNNAILCFMVFFRKIKHNRTFKIKGAEFGDGIEDEIDVGPGDM